MDAVVSRGALAGARIVQASHPVLMNLILVRWIDCHRGVDRQCGKPLVLWVCGFHGDVPRHYLRNRA